jgi:hypothetical protein
MCIGNQKQKLQLPQTLQIRLTRLLPVTQAQHSQQAIMPQQSGHQFAQKFTVHFYFKFLDTNHC